DNHLRFALQLIALGRPVVVALNMIDLARRDGLEIDAAKLSAALGVPVVETIAVRKRGIDELKAAVAGLVGDGARPAPVAAPPPEAIVTLQRRARAIAAEATLSESTGRRISHRIDQIALHPV